MKMLALIRKIKNAYRRFILCDPVLLEAARWFKDRGDETLRLTYPLQKDSIVFDLGGYVGDFAASIRYCYGSKVYLFEPVPDFFSRCVERFREDSSVICFNFGLSSKDEWRKIGVSENSSSFFSAPGLEYVLVETRCAKDFLQSQGVEEIDLMKINIEGGEYDVLPALFESGDILKIKYLQIQFHDFVPGARDLRKEIRDKLRLTHTEMWNYEFVWESWSRIE